MLLVFGGTAWADDWADCARSAVYPDRAIGGCSNIIRAGRENGAYLATAYYERGAAYGGKGDYDRVIADETKALELNPQLVYAYVSRGAAYGNKANYDQEIADDTKAIELDPKLADAYVDRGHAYGNEGNYDQEIADENKAVEFNPKLADAYVDRGFAYGNEGNYDQEIADENKAIELKPDLALPYVNRGAAYGSKGNYDQQIADDTKAIELNQDSGYAYYGRGYAYEAKGDPANAVTDFRAASQLIPPSDHWRDQALAHLADLDKQTLVPPTAPATPAPGHRVALVIGNSTYRNVSALNNPVNDAGLIAGALRADGFDTTVADNLDRDGLIEALKAFASKADSADWAVVFFAGHGIEMGGTNYLIPVDAKLLTDRDVELEAVPSSEVMHAIDGAHQLRVVILDACRDNPFADTMRRTGGEARDIGRGLARIEPGRGTLVLYSAKEGTIAADGDGADSPFATALAKHLTEPGIEVDKMFRLVIDDVSDATGNKQEPFMYGSLPGRQDFSFRPQS
jgi:tetratricopeptide (TPR) repeat protein